VNAESAGPSPEPNRRLGIWIAVIAAAAVIAYVTYMVLGMPGMNHALPALK